jgi:hypothetical protein
MCCQNNEEVIAVAAAEQERESGEVVAEHSGAAVHRPEPLRAGSELVPTACGNW